MVDVRTDGTGHVEPQPVNEIDVLWREHRRVGTEEERVVAASAVMDDQTDLERGRRRRVLPGLAEQPRLRGG